MDCITKWQQHISYATNVPAPGPDPKATNPTQIGSYFGLTHKPILIHFLHGRKLHPLVFRMSKQTLVSPATISMRQNVLAHLSLELAIAVGRTW